MCPASPANSRPFIPSELKPSFWVSPGYYMGYWSNLVQKYDITTCQTHVKLKPHREMWVGAIIAAALTKGHESQYFVGLPPSEPPDVEIRSLIPIELKGREAQDFIRIPVEVVRCSLEEGEDILEHIQAKNRIGYKGMILAVYAYGSVKVDNLNEIQAEIKKLPVFYPEQVILVAKIDQAGDVQQPPDTFLVTQIYPERTQAIISLEDEDAFFSAPSVITAEGMKFGRGMDDLGDFMLLYPELNTPNS